MLFKEKNSLEKRRAESSRIRAKYLDRIPVIIEKNSKNDVDIIKTKYLVPFEFTLGQLAYVIRKQMRLTPDKALFFFINNLIPSTSSTIGSLYENNRDSDGFLYIIYSNESVYGI